jgi:hypothetical protein
MSELRKGFQQVQAEQIIEQLSQLRPEFGTADLLRMGLLIVLQSPDVEELNADELESRCQQVSLRLSQTSDQHAAVADELDSLAAAAPCDFSPEHVWTMVRALKVQGQLLNLYLGPSEASF